MPELRRNPVTGQWVIIAEERSGRFRERTHHDGRLREAPYSEQCPFCPGNEALTPPSVLEIPDPAGRWQVRGFPNKYPALSPEPSPEPSVRGRFFHAMPGEGVHEVIVESPVHNRLPACMTQSEMISVVQAHHERYLALLKASTIEYVLVFKNYGDKAGTSLKHPHSQVIGTPVVPDDVGKRGSLAEEHYRREGQCLLCRVVGEELRSGERVVCRDAHYAVFHPFAASHFAETWIVPMDHQPSFGVVASVGLARFGSILGRTLKQLSVAFGDPDFNYVIHSSPRSIEGESRAYWHWYLRLIPRVADAGGFELGTGIYINTARPETTAESMRRAAI